MVDVPQSGESLGDGLDVNDPTGYVESSQPLRLCLLGQLDVVKVTSGAAAVSLIEGH